MHNDCRHERSNVLLQHWALPIAENVAWSWHEGRNGRCWHCPYLKKVGLFFSHHCPYLKRYWHEENQSMIWDLAFWKCPTYHYKLLLCCLAAGTTHLLVMLQMWIVIMVLVHGFRFHNGSSLLCCAVMKATIFPFCCLLTIALHAAPSHKNMMVFYIVCIKFCIRNAYIYDL